MFLFFYFILKFGNYDFFILVCFIYIKCMGNVKVGIVCDEFIKYFLIRFNEFLYYKNIYNLLNM